MVKKNRAPERTSARSMFSGRDCLGGFCLAFDHLHLTAIDGDAAGLLLFRNDPLQLDVEQSVLELRALDLDVLGQLEAALERTAGNSLIEIGLLAVAGVFPLALDRQHALAHLDVQLLFAEAGDRNGDAVM